MVKLILILFLLFTFPTFILASGEIDIPEETRPTINKANQDSVVILLNTKTIKVYINHGYMSGSNFIKIKERLIIWRDVVDDPDTPEDETSAKFTEFMLHLDKPAIKAMIKAEY